MKKAGIYSTIKNMISRMGIATKNKNIVSIPNKNKNADMPMAIKRNILKTKYHIRFKSSAGFTILVSIKISFEGILILP
ncbi:MAG: hypothetical protein U1C33_08835 [Candidatus Cloacimonadaceae bacterium]|nr:hypothetical protein [Candidatus Cloacimonadaceae bacterium]